MVAPLVQENDSQFVMMSSEITEFYKGSTIFLTGGTGFLGRLLIEKLLRSCPDLKKLYILVRPKKGKDVQTRFQDIFKSPAFRKAFDRLKHTDKDFAKRLILVAGDFNKPNLGLSQGDQMILIEEIDCIIHSAATVRFDEPLKTAITINTKAVRDLIGMAKKMTKLRAMVHISTAYSHCTRTHIDEIIYDIPISGKNLIELSEILDSDQLEEMAPTIMSGSPNSYILTKAAAEDIIKTEGQDLPIAIVRPSMIVGSVREPIAGWIDNFYGPVGLIVAGALGILHSLYLGKHLGSDVVPVDYTVNCVLATVWNVATAKITERCDDETQSNNVKKWQNKVPPVYNFVSGPQAKITWDRMIQLTEKHGLYVPSPLMVWHHFMTMRSNKSTHMIADFFYHRIPAFIADFIAACIGKKPIFMKAYRKYNKFMTILEFFMIREWTYTNGNVTYLWARMNATDKSLYEFSMENFDWDSYINTFIRGARVYLLKDPLDTIPQGRVKYYKLMIAHYVLVIILSLIALKIVSSLFCNLVF